MIDTKTLTADVLTDMIDLTAITLSDLTAVELRKLGGQVGIKGASKGKRGDLLSDLSIIRNAQQDMIDAQRKAAEKAKSQAAPKAEPKKCNVCGKRRPASKGNRNGTPANGICTPCYEEGGWENTHNDAGHGDLDLNALTDEQAEEVHGCWICYPELNEAQREPRAGRSRAGMVIIAKGTEIHKSATFREAAEKLGWTVTVQEQTYDDGDALNTRYYANAHKGQDAIQLAWDGRAYDYPGSSARLAGKDRKVRNLKEALRFLAK